MVNVCGVSEAPISLVCQERMAALEMQANQLGLQAAQECERMAKDRTLALQILQKVGSRRT